MEKLVLVQAEVFTHTETKAFDLVLVLVLCLWCAQPCGSICVEVLTELLIDEVASPECRVVTEVELHVHVLSGVCLYEWVQNWVHQN